VKTPFVPARAIIRARSARKLRDEQIVPERLSNDVAPCHPFLIGHSVEGVFEVPWQADGNRLSHDTPVIGSNTDRNTGQPE
jgi:hypothetical protein